MCKWWKSLEEADRVRGRLLMSWRQTYPAQSRILTILYTAGAIVFGITGFMIVTVAVKALL